MMTQGTKTEKNIQNWRDDEALKRFKIISPLLDDAMDKAKRVQMRKEIAEKNGISERTVYRYEKAYIKKEFQGLKPAERSQHNATLPDNFDELLSEAIQLLREVPKRSVNQLIWILELEGKVAPGLLKRSTLQRHLQKKGFGKRQLQTYADARKSSSKRFCKPHRMMLLQADIKYGAILPIGKNGEKVQTYLSSVIDDHSRYILQASFYDNQEEKIIEDTFHKAIVKYGKFDHCYFDNGSQYRAKQLNLSLAKLGINVRFAPVRSGRSKGKIERYHQVVDVFLEELKLENDVKSLEILNQKWEKFLDTYYQKSPHEGIAEYYRSLGSDVPENGISPKQEWDRDSRNLCFLDVNTVAEAFLHHEKRRVDKGACISFQGRMYETKPELIGFEVEISYDPAAPETITVNYPGIESFTAKPLKIGPYCSKKPALPVSMQENKPEGSRLLKALEKEYDKNAKVLADALSFENYGKEA